jgi:hypothetical protein
MKSLLALLIALTGSAFLLEAQATTRQPPADIEATIGYLIDVVATSGHTFLRNSTRYSAAQAAQHLQRKYQHFRDKIHTVDDFIELAASRSLLTGKPYLVIDTAGSSMPTSQWLQQVLSDYCAQRDADRVSAPSHKAGIACPQ